jgi:cytochrome c biogenesis protein CcmG/thiol:disulfide interchange protein DsbE
VSRERPARWGRPGRPARWGAGSARRAAVGLVLVAAAAGCTGEDPPSIAAPPETAGAAVACFSGTAASGQDLLPELSLPCLGTGGTVSLRSLAGTPTVVNLWASWCDPCREELPAFSRLSADAGGRLRVLGVASKDREQSARAANLPFPSLFDPDGDLLRGLGRSLLPATVLLDASGRVREVYQGVPLTDATLRALVRDRLGVDV